ncbi:phenylacetate--CoA ligase family protein [Salipiger sp. IMCC34102]|uniref:phenylacetate--CoA ligase family protein n=1 Tax=Salipiger sp. IMCC34102 TaxID=2510647 RepID=UPI00101C0034|nr:AMP-binding protein [Salipiger sp. IMCC34102]RYH01531.1 phenylacetate--CoA ligase family protein [Salipiger sp. IMCC34102]
MTPFYDDLETRSTAARAQAQLAGLKAQVAQVKASDASWLGEAVVDSLDDLVELPVLRKSDLVEMQTSRPPFGGIPVDNVSHVFQSPGPIHEPGGNTRDWWRFGRFLHACGIGREDIVQNCFAYHLTPAGTMFENGAAAVGARVLPAGTGQTDQQIAASAALGATAYAGTPDYLKVILDRARESGTTLGFTKAAVSGGALFPALRQVYADAGITCRQCYATADLGLIAYEAAEEDGMILDEHVIVEIVTPGTGTPVPDGEVGEVVVTTLNPDYPLIRFATGDLSAILSGQSATGRTNRRIKGWMGRADQTTKIKGMFVRPEQVAALVAVTGAERARIVADRDGDTDTMAVQLEGTGLDAEAAATSVTDILKLRGRVTLHAPGTLPRDGLVIEDRRNYET